MFLYFRLWKAFDQQFFLSERYVTEGTGILMSYSDGLGTSIFVFPKDSEYASDREKVDGKVCISRLSRHFFLWEQYG